MKHKSFLSTLLLGGVLLLQSNIYAMKSKGCFNSFKNSESKIHKAIFQDYSLYQICKMLDKEPELVFERGKGNQTILMAAIFKGRDDLFEEFFKRCKDCSKVILACDELGKNVLHYIALKRKEFKFRSEFLPTLKKYIVSPQKYFQYQKVSSEMVSNVRQLLWKRGGSKKLLPLDYAASICDYEFVEFFLSYSPSIEQLCDFGGQTTLHKVFILDSKGVLWKKMVNIEKTASLLIDYCLKNKLEDIFVIKTKGGSYSIWDYMMGCQRAGYKFSSDFVEKLEKHVKDKIDIKNIVDNLVWKSQGSQSFLVETEGVEFLNASIWGNGNNIFFLKLSNLL